MLEKMVNGYRERGNNCAETDEHLIYSCIISVNRLTKSEHEGYMLFFSAKAEISKIRM